MKFEVFKFIEVTSTNDMAIDLIKEKKREFGFVYSETQTRGKGTHGKKWISEKGNLFATIFFNLRNNYPSIDEFTTINPVIISSVIEQFCDKRSISFKKPNDIFVNKKKICGILQEVITHNDKKFLIIGIGINVTNNPLIKLKNKATNLFDESKKSPTIMELIELITSSYEKFFLNLNQYKYINFKKKAEAIAFT